MAAQDMAADILDRTFSRSLPVASATEAAYRSDPAAMYFRDSVQLSTVAAHYDFLSKSQPVMVQLGTGHNLAGLEASSYMPLHDGAKVWGNASFTAGQYRDIRFTDCIDYLYIAPYVLGDEAGGDLSTRRYDFSGGYARDFGRMVVGAELRYRAEIAHRNVDPRIKTIVSDLHIQAAASYRLSEDYTAGISLGADIYNQDCDVDFYNPINDINTLTLTGMGTYYKRFMGNANKNSGYHSTGIKAGLHLLPVSGHGIFANVDFSTYRMEQQLRNFNNLVLGYTDNKLLQARVIYRTTDHAIFRAAPGIVAGMMLRKGTENLFGTAAGASYDKIGSRSPYAHDIYFGRVECPMQLTFGQSTLSATPAAGYMLNKESYTDPQRRLEASRISPALTFDYRLLTSGRWACSASAGGILDFATEKKRVLTGLGTGTALGRSVIHNFDMLCADARTFAFTAGASCSIGRQVVSLTATYTHTAYSGHGSSQNVSVILSSTF